MLRLPALLYFLQEGRKDEKLMYKRRILHPGQRFSRLSGYTRGTDVPPHSRTHARMRTHEQNLTRNPKITNKSSGATAKHFFIAENQLKTRTAGGLSPPKKPCINKKQETTRVHRHTGSKRGRERRVEERLRPRPAPHQR